MSGTVETQLKVTEANILEATIGKQYDIANILGLDPKKTEAKLLARSAVALSEEIDKIAESRNPQSLLKAYKKADQLKKVADVLNGTQNLQGAFTKAERVQISDIRQEFQSHDSIIYQVERDGETHTLVVQNDSNNLVRNRDYASDDVKTTQEENFENSRHDGKKLEFVSHKSAGIVAEEAIKLAETAQIYLKTIDADRDSGSRNWERKGQRIKAAALEAGLGEEVSELLYKLTGKVIRTAKAEDGSDALDVNDAGVLRSRACYDDARSDGFAGAVFAELK